MKNKTKSITVLSTVILFFLCLLFLVRHASYSTDEVVRRRAVMAYYHTIGRSAEKREAARYLFDNMPYHYGYGVTVHDSKEVKRWAKETTETLRNLLDEYGLYQIPSDTIRALRDERRADSLAMQRIDKEVQSEFIPMMDGSQLTASFLIRHINHAFKVWRTSRFAKKLTFDEFKEYILPYKAFNGYSFLEPVPDVLPEFPGGMSEMIKFIRENLRYPTICQEQGIQGRVVVQFIIDENGNIINPQVKDSINPYLDKEAMRVVSIMPRWKPGMLDGKPIPTRFVFPVTFRLSN